MMPRYIDADYLKQMRNDVISGKLKIETESDLIDACPTADVTEVKRGEWVGGRFDNYSGYYEEQCSNCKEFSREYTRPYCPNCGAIMNKERKDI